jgi:hypothetical protein
MSAILPPVSSNHAAGETPTKTMNSTPNPNRLKPGHYWCVIDQRGRQIHGGTNRRAALRVQKGTSFKLVQRPKN